jgi:hypothetical protein
LQRQPSAPSQVTGATTGQSQRGPLLKTKIRFTLPKGPRPGAAAAAASGPSAAAVRSPVAVAASPAAAAAMAAVPVGAFMQVRRLGLACGLLSQVVKARCYVTRLKTTSYTTRKRSSLSRSWKYTLVTSPPYD